MDLLTIEHQDFTMSIECSKFDAIWDKALRNVGARWSDRMKTVVFKR